jgi:hypothetical protein
MTDSAAVKDSALPLWNNCVVDISVGIRALPVSLVQRERTFLVQDDAVKAAQDILLDTKDVVIAESSAFERCAKCGRGEETSIEDIAKFQSQQVRPLRSLCASLMRYMSLR